MREGKNLGRRKQFEAATKTDGAFALAFSKLAQTYSNLGYDAEAERAAQRAVEFEPEPARGREVSDLCRPFPDQQEFSRRDQSLREHRQSFARNSDVQSALAGSLRASGRFCKARRVQPEDSHRESEGHQRNLALGRLAIKSDNAQGGLDPLNRALTLSVQIG